jgi:hypothetical protein
MKTVCNWNLDSITKRINRFHSFHCQFHKNENKPYSFDIDYVISYAEDIKGKNVSNTIYIDEIIEILNKIKTEIIGKNVGNAKELLLMYVLQIFDKCNGSSKEMEVFNYLMGVIYICSYCGGCDEMGGVFDCNGCHRQYCHECVYDGFIHGNGMDTRRCLHCAGERIYVKCSMCNADFDIIDIKKKCYKCNRNLCLECHLKEQHGRGICWNC